MPLVDSWASLLRGWPLRSSGDLSSPGPPLRLMRLWLAQAWTSMPSALTCSLQKQAAPLGQQCAANSGGSPDAPALDAVDQDTDPAQPVCLLRNQAEFAGVPGAQHQAERQVEQGEQGSRRKLHPQVAR